MTLSVTRGGLLVGLAIFGVIAYEFRTVFEALGVSVPLLPYLALVFVGATLAVIVISFRGGFGTDAEANDPT